MFGGVRFDGIPQAKTHFRRVADSGGVHSDGDGVGMDIGYPIPTSALTIPDVPNPTTISNVSLVCSVFVDVTKPDPASWRLNYAFNGGASHAVPFDTVPSDHGGSGSSLFSIPIDKTELVTGTNTVTLTSTGFGAFPSGYWPYVGNIQLVYTPI